MNLAAVCHALPGTIHLQNPIRNRWKALEIVGRHPACDFPAAGALCRRRDAPSRRKLTQGREADSEWFWKGWGWFCELPPAPSCDSRSRYTRECDLSLRKPLEDVLFIIQYHRMAIRKPQAPPIVANPVIADTYRVFAPERDPPPKTGIQIACH